MIASIALTMVGEIILPEMRKALRHYAAEFHGGTSWGKKTWSRECRRYLERHYGLPPIERAPVFPDDIIFPWRK